MATPAPPVGTTPSDVSGPPGRKPVPTSNVALSRMPESEPVEAMTCETEPEENAVAGSPEATSAQPSSTDACANSSPSTVFSSETVDRSHSSLQPPPKPHTRFDIVQAGYWSSAG